MIFLDPRLDELPEVSLEPMEEEATHEEWKWLELEPVEEEPTGEEVQMPVLEPLEDEGADTP